MIIPNSSQTSKESCSALLEDRRTLWRQGALEAQVRRALDALPQGGDSNLRRQSKPVLLSTCSASPGNHVPYPVLREGWRAFTGGSGGIVSAIGHGGSAGASSGSLHTASPLPSTLPPYPDSIPVHEARTSVSYVSRTLLSDLFQLVRPQAYVSNFMVSWQMTLWAMRDGK